MLTLAVLNYSIPMYICVLWLQKNPTCPDKFHTQIATCRLTYRSSPFLFLAQHASLEPLGKYLRKAHARRQNWNGFTRPKLDRNNQNDRKGACTLSDDSCKRWRWRSLPSLSVEGWCSVQNKKVLLPSELRCDRLSASLLHYFGGSPDFTAKRQSE